MEPLLRSEPPTAPTGWVLVASRPQGSIPQAVPKHPGQGLVKGRARPGLQLHPHNPRDLISASFTRRFPRQTPATLALSTPTPGPLLQRRPLPGTPSLPPSPGSPLSSRLPSPPGP